MFFAVPINAGIRVVTNTNNSGPGSLRQTIADALPEDTVRFSSSLLAGGNDTILLASSISFAKTLTIIGLYNSNDTLFISGSNANRIFNVDMTMVSGSRQLILDSLFLINAYSSSNGGAINFIGEFLSIKNSVIKNCTANYNGGAIFAKDDSYAYFSDARIDAQNLVVSNNKTLSGWGGGISLMAQEEAVINFKNVTVKDNIGAVSGGGLYCYSNIMSTKVSIDSSSFVNNSSTNSGGGGIYIRTISKNSSSIDSSRFVLTNSEVLNNSGANGGGIHLFLDSYYDYSNYVTQIENCLIEGNQSQDNGGGIYIYFDLYSPANYPKVNINRSTITNNNAQVNGGGIYLEAPYTVQSSAYLMLEESSISNNNALENGGGIYTKSYYTYTHLYLSTINDNHAIKNGGGIYALSNYSHPFADYLAYVNTSTIVGNVADSLAGGMYAKTSYMFDTIMFVKNATIVNNQAMDGADGILTEFGSYSLPASSRVHLVTLSSIIALNGSQNIVTDSLLSRGYNAFGDAFTPGSTGTDQVGLNSSDLNLIPLSLNGGLTQTMLPGLNSLAIDMGNANDHARAQNGTFAGIRDAGSAESCISVSRDTVEVCGSYTFASVVYFSSGVYYDTLTNSSGCDSIRSLYLTIRNVSHDTLAPISICSNDSVLIFGDYHSVAGYYSDSLTSSFGCDSVTTVQLIVINMNHDTLSPISICSGDSALIFGNYQSISGYYSDSLSNVFGCDSIISVLLTIRDLNHDTLMPVIICSGDSTLIFGDFQSTAGFYSDTLLNIYGCDSIVVQELMVETLDVSTSTSGTTITASETGAVYQWIDCNNGGSHLFGETSQSFTATSNGDYAVVINKNGCTDTSSCVGIYDVSISKKQSSLFKIYPNPSNGVFMIEFDQSNSSYDVQIIDVLGKTVQHFETVAQKQEVDLSAYHDGVYFIKVNSVVVKVIKE